MAKVRDALGAGTALIEYFWGDRFLFVFGMSRQKFVIKKIDLDKTRIQRITQLLNIIKQVRLDTADKQMSGIQRDLILCIQGYPRASTEGMA